MRLSNPPWATNALKKYYEALERHVPADLLPRPIVKRKHGTESLDNYITSVTAEIQKLEAKRAAGALSVGQALLLERDRKDLEKAKKLMRRPLEQGFREYGCGHYGCVYPTQRPGIVLKISTDKTEAAFIACALSIGEWPSGIVQYHKVLRLEGTSHANRPLYAIWRDEIRPDSTLVEIRDNGRHDWEMLRNMISGQRQIGHEIRTMLLRSRNPQKLLAACQPWIQWAKEEVRLLDGTRNVSAHIGRDYQTPKRLGLLFATWENICENGDLSYSWAPFHALRFYFEKGILLADVHLANVGQAWDWADDNEEWVISDPGHAVLLDNRYDTVTVPVA